MSRHLSTVNYKRLIKDLADMYPYPTDEVVLVECIANALDAKASHISVDYDAGRRVLVVTDNGHGMNKAEFAQYHDFAKARKVRSRGIGFAGLGAKIAFKIARTVVTESRSDSFVGGSRWGFTGKGDLVWDEIHVTKLKKVGTRVEIHFRRDIPMVYHNKLDISDVIRRHYLPLLHTRSLEFYKTCHTYLRPLQFVVNGKVLPACDLVEDFHLSNVWEDILTLKGREGRPIGYYFWGLVPEGVNPFETGILVCTMGKVIKPEMFGFFPKNIGPRIFGMVEIPELVQFLTTNKTQFSGGKQFLQYYGALRSEFKTWLTNLGETTEEPEYTGEVRDLRREIARIISSFPELAEFAAQYRRSQIQKSSQSGEETSSPTSGSVTYSEGEGAGKGTKGPLAPGDEDIGGALKSDEKGAERSEPISRKARAGPRIGFKASPSDNSLGWVDGDTIVINSGHPAYRRTALPKRLRLLHNLFAIAVSFQRFLRDTGRPDPRFVDRFLEVWGRSRER